MKPDNPMKPDSDSFSMPLIRFSSDFPTLVSTVLKQSYRLHKKQAAAEGLGWARRRLSALIESQI
jgi:hypothetical protein